MKKNERNRFGDDKFTIEMIEATEEVGLNSGNRNIRRTGLVAKISQILSNDAKEVVFDEGPRRKEFAYQIGLQGKRSSTFTDFVYSLLKIIPRH